MKTYTILEHQLLCLVQQLMDDHEQTKTTLDHLVNEWSWDGCHYDANSLLDQHPCEQERRENDPVLVAKLEEKEKARLAEIEATKGDMG